MPRRMFVITFPSICALLALGLLVPQSSDFGEQVRGTIAAANLAKLAEIEAVRFVGPAPVEAARK